MQGFGLKRFLVLAAGGLLALPAAALAAAEITVGDNFFRPDAVSADVSPAGETTFHWEWGPAGLGSANLHNVNQDDRLFRSGAPKRTGSYDLTASAGTYHYYCEVHGFPGGGQDGTLKVRPVVFPVAARDGGAVSSGAAPVFDVRWASDQTETGDRYDVRYRVKGKKWRTWKEDTEQPSAIFGANGPVPAKAGKTYEIKARSQKGKGEKKRSSFSPPVSFPP